MDEFAIRLVQLAPHAQVGLASIRSSAAYNDVGMYGLSQSQQFTHSYLLLYYLQG